MYFALKLVHVFHVFSADVSKNFVWYVLKNRLFVIHEIKLKSAKKFKKLAVLLMYIALKLVYRFHVFSADFSKTLFAMFSKIDYL